MRVQSETIWWQRSISTTCTIMRSHHTTMILHCWSLLIQWSCPKNDAPSAWAPNILQRTYWGSPQVPWWVAGGHWSSRASRPPSFRSWKSPMWNAQRVNRAAGTTSHALCSVLATKVDRRIRARGTVEAHMPPITKARGFWQASSAGGRSVLRMESMASTPESHSTTHGSVREQGFKSKTDKWSHV